MAVHACDPSPLEAEAGGHQVKAYMNYRMRLPFLPPPQKTKEKRRGGRGRKGKREAQREVEGRVGGQLDPRKSITEEKGKESC